MRIEFTKLELDAALYHLTDIMDRCICYFSLVGETLRSIKDDNQLKGTVIYVAIRRLDFSESAQSMLATLSRGVDLRLGIDDYQKDGDYISWKFKGVPISIKIVHRKYEFFNNPSFMFYMGEDYRIPNPFNKYWKIRNLIA